MYSEPPNNVNDDQDRIETEAAATNDNPEAGTRDQEAGDNPPASQQPVTNSYLFACIFGRCGDSSASVRAQALKTLGDITTDQNDGVKDVINKIFAPDKINRGQLAFTELLEKNNNDNVELLPSGQELIEFLRKRALDQSVFVRKSALQVLENILKSSTSLMADDLVAVLSEHCRDPSLAVR